LDDSRIIEIWPAATGIVGLSKDTDVFAPSSIEKIRNAWQQRRDELDAEGLPAVSAFMARLGREWSIETGIIEGIYNIERGVTQSLIEEGFQAALLDRNSTNKPPEFVLSVLRDQEAALEGLFAFVKQERELTTSYIKELHAAMLRSQTHCDALDPDGRVVEVALLKGEYKQHENYPQRDGRIYTYCPPLQTESEMQRLVELDAQHEREGFPVEVRAAWLHHRFTQIHPFQDGNGRVARALASLLFIRDGLFPLVVNYTDKSDYLDNLEAADAGRLKGLVDQFVELQSRWASNAMDATEPVLKARRKVRDSLAGLKRTLDVVSGVASDPSTSDEPWAKAIDAMNSLESRLTAVGEEIRGIFTAYDADASFKVERSEQSSASRHAKRIAKALSLGGDAEGRSGHVEWVSLSIKRKRKNTTLTVFATSRTTWLNKSEVVCSAFLDEFVAEGAAWQRVDNPATIGVSPYSFNKATSGSLSPEFQEWVENTISALVEVLHREL